MPKAKVNGKEIEFEAGLTVLQVAELAGEEIPRFCYHERLSIAGNCRMCLVEVKPGPPKPQASCALPAADNQEIFTNTAMVKKAREGVMEFLLINHPLDCPICDQGGECDLQDEALGYGRDGSRFRENKRAVEEKAMGPLIKTVMTRCIQCTRCVRFITEIAGMPEIGMAGRGEDAEITTYLEKAVSSELSGNLVDVCPVGALTSKPYAFNARPWELTKTESVDVMDAVGSAIRVDARGEQVLRILPRLNEAINEEWISDKTRHACDGLSRQRLDRPYVRVGGALREASWTEALGVAAERLMASDPSRIGIIAGDLQDAESMKAALDLFTGLGVRSLDCRQDGSAHHPQFGRQSYLFNTTIAGIEAADAIVLIGSNPRKEAALINARIRKRWIAGPVRIGAIGEQVDLNFPHEHLGVGADALERLTAWDGLQGAERPLFIVGPGAAAGPNGKNVLAAAALAAQKTGALRPGWNGWGALHAAASRVAGLDLGFVPKEGGLGAPAMIKKGALDVLMLLGADETSLSETDAFVIYLGSHGDQGASRADVILPAAAYTEKSGIYVNTEGRVQLGSRAVYPKGDSREDWAILRALAGRLGISLGYDTHEALRMCLMRDHPSFGQVDYVEGPEAGEPFDPAVFGAPVALSDAPLRSPVEDFYMTNPIARASVVMAQCSALHARPQAAALAAE